MTRRWQFMAVLAACVLGTALGARGVTTLVHQTHAQGARGQVLAAPISVLPSIGASGEVRARPSTDAAIRSAEAAVRRAPDSAAGYIALALAYMQKERETSDVTYYNLTDDALKAALRLDPENASAINYEAWVALGRHDFRLAAALARRAINLNRYDAANYGTLGDAEANLGNYGAMASAYQRMVDLEPSLVSYNRASYARWLYGDLRNAVRFMLMAIRSGSTQKENVAWCETQLGDDYFNDGFVLPAEQEYRAALRTFPHYAAALAGMAAVQNALGHPQAAVRDYQRAIAVVPLPQYVTALGDLYARLGNQEAARRQYALIRFIDRIFAVNHVRYGVETAQFDADHNQRLGEALSIARAEAAVRHDVQTMDTLAWVLYKNGRYAEAWRAEKEALRLGTHYAPFYFHAGMIQAKLGNLVEAQSYLSMALMVNPNFSVLNAPVARAELLRVSKKVEARSATAKPVRP